MISGETEAKVFPCEFWKIFKNTYFSEVLQTSVAGETLKCPLVKDVLYIPSVFVSI